MKKFIKILAGSSFVCSLLISNSYCMSNVWEKNSTTNELDKKFKSLSNKIQQANLLNRNTNEAILNDIESDHAKIWKMLKKNYSNLTIDAQTYYVEKWQILEGETNSLRKKNNTIYTLNDIIQEIDEGINSVDKNQNYSDNKLFNTLYTIENNIKLLMDILHENDNGLNINDQEYYQLNIIELEKKVKKLNSVHFYYIVERRDQALDELRILTEIATHINKTTIQQFTNDQQQILDWEEKRILNQKTQEELQKDVQKIFNLQQEGITDKVKEGATRLLKTIEDIFGKKIWDIVK